MKGSRTSKFDILPLLTGWSSGWTSVAINLILLAAWLWLYRPVLQTLPALFASEEFRTNLIVLVAVAGLLIYRVRATCARLRLDVTPRLFLPGLILLLAGSLGYLLVERFLAINSLSASLFVLASYGLLGLWLAPDRWRSGLPAMLLVVGVLPFGAQLETFLGYPLRILTAGLARDMLAGFGFHSVGVDTILVFESGVSQVDIPCSGVKSLWTGALFLLGATWVENRPLNLRWLLVAAVTGVLLVIANFLRVAILSLTGPALGWTELARMLHVPLGVLGFVGACAAAVFLLGRLKEKPAPESAEPPRELRKPFWLGPLLVGCVLAMLAAYTPRAAALAEQPAPAPWSFAEGLRVQLSPLSTRELAWIRLSGAESADRYVFQWQNDTSRLNDGQPVSGTFMLLTSQTWPAQHQPERCFEVFGLTVRQSYTYLAANDFPLRYLSLSAAGETEQVSAVYWLQSANQTTDDYSRPIWASLASQRERWVLVTVLFDKEYVKQIVELKPFFDALRDSINRSLMKGNVP